MVHFTTTSCSSCLIRGPPPSALDRCLRSKRSSSTPRSRRSTLRVPTTTPRRLWSPEDELVVVEAWEPTASAEEGVLAVVVVVEVVVVVVVVVVVGRHSGGIGSPNSLTGEKMFYFVSNI